jgi:hypothetical protein
MSARYSATVLMAGPIRFEISANWVTVGVLEDDSDRALSWIVGGPGAGTVCIQKVVALRRLGMVALVHFRHRHEAKLSTRNGHRLTGPRPRDGARAGRRGGAPVMLRLGAARYHSPDRATVVLARLRQLDPQAIIVRIWRSCSPSKLLASVFWSSGMRALGWGRNPTTNCRSPTTVSW